MPDVRSLPIVAIHPVHGAPLYFDQPTHRYHCGPRPDWDPGAYCSDPVELVSVTRFVKHYFPEFDAPTIAARVAARDGRPVAEVLQEWEATGAAACLIGTRVHAIAEDAMCGRTPRHAPESDRERTLMGAAWQCVQDLRAAGWQLLAAEQPVFSDRLGLAGTIDLSARDPDGRLVILDWKTNETIDATAKYGGKGLGPCAGLDDCHLIRYALQLQTYAAILQLDRWAAEPVGVLLLHVTPAGVVPVELPDVTTTVNAMLLNLVVSRWDVEVTA